MHLLTFGVCATVPADLLLAGCDVIKEVSKTTTAMPRVWGELPMCPKDWREVAA